MSDSRKRFYILKILNLQVVGILLLILLAACLLWFNNSNSCQAVSPTAAQVRFDGEYRVGDGQWQKIIE